MVSNLTSFGIHQATFKDILDGSWGIAKILGSAEADLKQELIPLEGGSSMVPWAAAPGRASGELTLTIRQYDKQILKFLSPYLAGASDSETLAGEASGSITTVVNAKGTSVKNNTTGIASIAITTAADLAPGNYKVVAASATTVDIYIDYDGTGNASYQDNEGKVNSTAITIASGAGTVFKGLTITGGSGTIGFTTGDIATFTVNPISNYLLKRYFGKVGAQLREFSLTIYSECVGGKIRRTTYPRCIASASTPVNFLENEWAAMEATIMVLQPEVEDYVAETVFINK